MSPRILLAVTARVLTQLRRDHRTLAMLLVLIALLAPRLGLQGRVPTACWSRSGDLAADLSSCGNYPMRLV